VCEHVQSERIEKESVSRAPFFAFERVEVYKKVEKRLLEVTAVVAGVG